MSQNIKKGRSAQGLGTVLFLGSIVFSSKTFVKSEKIAYVVVGTIGLGMFFGGSLRVAVEKQKVQEGIE